jgi:TRAP-type C4-dicarboxylate transport system permease small subunit
MARPSALRTWLDSIDEQIAALALGLMMLIPLIEIVMRPLMGSGISNAPVVVQHLGLVLAMFGALAAERHGHLTSFGSNDGSKGFTMLLRNQQRMNPYQQ